jgi:hypothetical protein
MGDDTGARRRYRAGPRRTAIVAGITLLASACGGPHAAAPNAAPGQAAPRQLTVQKETCHAAM